MTKIRENIDLSAKIDHVMNRFIINGIQYELNEDSKTASVISKEGSQYEGDIIIPSRICNEGIEYIVTKIEANAFYECNLLKSICLPDSIQEIGNSAFENCEILSNVILSDVCLINTNAFKKCVSLLSIIFPNSLKSIKWGAFDGCTSLVSIRIPQGVTNVESMAFSNCSSLCSIIVEKNNAVYNSNNSCNAIIETATNKLICGCNNTIIPHNCTAIESGAFAGCNLIRIIDIPADVREIGFAAFENCSSLVSFKIPQGITKISAHLFKDCVSLSSVEIPCSVQEILMSAFAGCKSLVHLDIPQSVEYIDMMAFKDCSSLQSLIIPDKVKCIDTKICEGCSNLKEFSIGSAITRYYACAFNDCSHLKTIDVPLDAFVCYCEDVRNDLLPLIGDREKIINKCLIQANPDVNGEYIVGDGIMHIGRRAFLGCNKISKIILPATVKSIGREAFMDCVELQEISLPDGVELLPTGAFHNCKNLKHVYLPNTLKEMNTAPFEGCESLEEIVLPEGLTNISENCFKDCKNLKRIIIPSSVKELGKLAISRCDQLQELKLPEGLIELNDFAIYGCANLETISLPSTLKVFRKPVGNLPKFKHFYIPLGTMSYFEKTCFRKYVVEHANETEYQKYLANELRYAAMYYRQLGMNITQIKWNENGSDSDAYKNPMDSNWYWNYRSKEQSLDYVMSMDWNNAGGLGVVLGYNNYRALDVDNINEELLNKLSKENKGIDYLIDKFLEILGLPNNYPWVIYSGSGKGFHIIFQSNDFDNSCSVYPFATKSGFFKRMELRWVSHLVLPPSMHANGHYKFRNDKFPLTSPAHIELSHIDKLIMQYCSKLEFGTYGNEDVCFNLVERQKIFTRCSSFIEEYYDVCEKDSIGWLNAVNSAESKNSLALRYLFGDKVEEDFYKALTLFKETSTQTALFNLLSLYAVRGWLCSYQEFWEIFSELDQELFSDYIERLKQNAEKNISRPKEYLFFDTECNGLPYNYQATVLDTNNWPRLIQLAWIVTDEQGNVIKSQNHIIYPDGFVIDSAVANLTGINTTRAQLEGINLQDALNEFMQDVASTEKLIGHNVDFDRNIVGCELYRIGGAYNTLINKAYKCTMQESTDFCAIPSNSPYGGYKWPKLEELYRKLFGRMFDNAHDALSDVIATKECYFKLKELNIL